MRNWINLITETTSHEYPKRQGNSVAAYRQHVVDIIRHAMTRAERHQWKDWYADLSDFGKRGHEIARKMDEEGIISIVEETERVPHAQYGSFGRYLGYNRMVDKTTIKARPGPNFPQN
jgi:hypothetical protein